MVYGGLHGARPDCHAGWDHAGGQARHPRLRRVQSTRSPAVEHALHSCRLLTGCDRHMGPCRWMGTCTTTRGMRTPPTPSWGWRLSNAGPPPARRWRSPRARTSCWGRLICKTTTRIHQARLAMPVMAKPLSSALLDLCTIAVCTHARRHRGSGVCMRTNLSIVCARSSILHYRNAYGIRTGIHARTAAELFIWPASRA